VKIREANFGYLKTDDVDDLEPVNGKIEKNKSVKTYRRIRVTSLSTFIFAHNFIKAQLSAFR
jgi:hypothetical protein